MAVATETAIECLRTRIQSKVLIPMCPEKMHVDQLDIDEPLVRRLLAEQFPHWADLSIARVKSAGTENAIYRLGDDLAIRLPYRSVNTTQVDKDHRWLPLLDPHLPLPIPAPVYDPAESAA